MGKMIENIYTASEDIQPFPSPEDVFADPVAKYFEHLLPLVSVRLSIVNPAWPGWIHFVTPMEPFDGVVGQYTKRYHTYYLRENWIGFQIKHGKYHLLGDFRYFSLERPSLIKKLGNCFNSQLSDLSRRYRIARRLYERRRQQFLAYGAIYHRWAHKDASGHHQDEDRTAFIAEIGGQPGEGNWSRGFPFLKQPSVDEDGETIVNMMPLTDDNRPFHYIGSLDGFNYVIGAADGVLLFYDPEDQIALFTFDWT